MHNNIKIISVVVPTHNEEKNVKILYDRIVAVFNSLDGYEFELIFCDDSDDGTYNIIKSIHMHDSRVKLILLTRRFSQSIAISAGLKRTKGVAVIIMDSDLQDPPELIPELISMWENGNKVVYVVRDSNSNKLMHRLLSPIYYKLLRVLSFIPIPNNAGEFRIIDRVVVNFLNSLTEQTRFLRGLTIWPGFKSSELFIVRPKRLHGDTNYSLKSSLSVAIDGVVGFSNKPIRIVTFIGFLISFLSFVLIIFYLCLWLYMRELFAPGWISLFLGILLMGGLNLFAIGIIGEYVGRSYEELQNRPLYLTADEIGFD